MDKFIIKTSGSRAGIQYLLNPSKVGAAPGPRTFTHDIAHAKPFTNSEAHIYAGWLQRCGFRQVVVLPAKVLNA